MENNNVNFATFLKQYPDKNGYFGRYGGAYLPDELVPAFNEINDAYQTICKSSKFIQELRRIRKEFQGRPTPVYHCDRLSKSVGKCQIYLKREDLNHTGAHKLNHCMGEGLLASFMGKKKLIAETGGTTRRRSCDGCGVFRAEMRHLYGRSRREKAGAERCPYESSGRKRDNGHERAENAERSGRRGV